jgi:hypothetical protein
MSEQPARLRSDKLTTFQPEGAMDYETCLRSCIAVLSLDGSGQAREDIKTYFMLPIPSPSEWDEVLRVFGDQRDARFYMSQYARRLGRRDKTVRVRHAKPGAAAVDFRH